MVMGRYTKERVDFKKYQKYFFEKFPKFGFNFLF